MWAKRQQVKLQKQMKGEYELYQCSRRGGIEE